MITLLLDWVLLGWLFWPILAFALFVPHLIVKSSDKDFAGFPFIPVGVAIGVAWWRWPMVFPHTWGGAALVVGLYLLAGAAYSLFKYLQTLARFKGDVQACLKDIALNPEERVEHVRNKLDSEWGYDFEIENGAARLRWEKQPLANWWVWWPWFLCETVLDFISNLGDRLVALFKGFYQQLANHFSVKL